MLHLGAHRDPQRPELVAPVEDTPSWLQPFGPNTEKLADGMTLEELAGQHLQRSRQDTLMQADSSRNGSGPEASAMPVPAAPTAKQRAAHAITHLPYQPWCPDCVSGKGIEAQHRQSVADASAELLLQIDYAFTGMLPKSPPRRRLSARSLSRWTWTQACQTRSCAGTKDPVISMPWQDWHSLSAT